MKEDLAKLLHERCKKIQEDRGTWDSTLQEIAEYVIPEKADFTVEWTPGQQRNRRMFDATAGHALSLLSASLQSLLTNPSSDWLEAKPMDLDLADNDNVAEYVDNVVEIMMNHIYADGVSFIPNEHEFYTEAAAFGTGVMYVEESQDNDGTVLSVRTYPIRDVFFAESSKGLPDTTYLRRNMSARQIMQKFDKPSEDVKRAAENDPEKKFEVVHAVYPRADWPKSVPDKLRTSKEMPWASVWFERDSLHVLSESGYQENPYAIARWSKATGEVMGRGPGLMALPFIRALNAMVYTAMLASEKIADPPMLVPDDGVIGPIRSGPGGLTHYRAGGGAGDKIIQMPVQADLSGALAFVERNTDAIRNIFLNDKLQLNGGPQMTATEALIVQEESMRALGPVLGRLQTEFLTPFANRVFGILSRRGVFPDPPSELQGRRITFGYRSPINRAQKMQDAQTFMQAVEYLTPVVQMDPSALINFDADRIVRDTRKVFGYPADYLRDELVVEEMRNQQAQAQAQAADMQMAEQGVNVAATAADSGLIGGENE